MPDDAACGKLGCGCRLADPGRAHQRVDASFFQDFILAADGLEIPEQRSLYMVHCIFLAVSIISVFGKLRHEAVGQWNAKTGGEEVTQKMFPNYSPTLVSIPIQ